MPGRNEHQRSGGGRLIRHVVGQGQQVTLRHGDVFGKEAVNMLAQDGEIVTHVIEAKASVVIAGIVANCRVDGHAVADLKPGHPFAHSSHHPRAVATHDVGQLKPQARPAGQYPQIETVEGRGVHGQQNVPRPGHRLRQVEQMHLIEIAVLLEGQRLHHSSSATSSRFSL